MEKKLLILILMSFVFVGCSTVRGPSKESSMQITVAQLERKLSERDQEVEDLKYEVERLSSELEAVSSDDVEEPIIKRSSSVKQPAKQNYTTSSGSGDIIRVNVPAETVQKALKNAGYYTGSIDGKIGSGSQKAIKDFQKDHNLTADGVVGKKTWSELQTYLD